MSNSVKKAFDIIKFISNNQGKLSLSELGRQLGMNKTTLFRYLETLELLNILEKRDSNWYLGIELFSLGHKVDANRRIVDRIHPQLQEISRRLNETVKAMELKIDELRDLKGNLTPDAVGIDEGVMSLVQTNMDSYEKALATIWKTDGEARIKKLINK